MSRIDPTTRQTTASPLAVTSDSNQSRIAPNLNSPQTGATGTAASGGGGSREPTPAGDPNKPSLSDQLATLRANQLPTTPAPSAASKDPAAGQTTNSPAPNAGLEATPNPSSWAPQADSKALAANLAKDLNTQTPPQLPVPAEAHTQATQPGLDPQLQAEVNLARARALQINQNGTNEQTGQTGQKPEAPPAQLGQALDPSAPQQLSKPPETTPEAPAAPAAEVLANSNQLAQQQPGKPAETTPDAPAAPTAEILANSNALQRDAAAALAQQPGKPAETTPDAPAAPTAEAQPNNTQPQPQQLHLELGPDSTAQAQQLSQPPQTTPEAPAAAATEVLPNTNQQPQDTLLASQPQLQQSADQTLTQLLSKPPETTPEAPIAEAPQASASDNQHPRGDARSSQPAASQPAAAATTATKDGSARAGLDAQHPSALLLTDSKMGAAHLAALLTPATVLQQEGPAAARAQQLGPHGEVLTEGAEEAAAAHEAGPHSGLPEEMRGAQPSALAQANTAADAAARLGAERAAMLLQALSAAGQPLVAVVWTDIFRMQQARLDQLAANRGVDEDGEMAPTDSEEAIRRHRRIQGVDLSGTHGRGVAPGWDEVAEEDPLAGVDVWFRAALLATALQRPQIVTRMFRAATPHETQKIRFFRRDKAARFLEQWHALSEGQVPISALPDLPLAAAPALALAGRNAPQQGVQAREALHTWMEAAEQAYADLLQEATGALPGSRGARRGEQALEMIHGRDATSVTVSLSLQEAASMWGHIIRTNPPYEEPVVATTSSTAEDGLLADHAYAVLGTFRRGPQWMVALCNPAGSDGYSDACGIFGLPFDTLLKNASELTMLRRVRR